MKLTAEGSVHMNFRSYNYGDLQRLVSAVAPDPNHPNLKKNLYFSLPKFIKGHSRNYIDSYLQLKRVVSYEVRC